MNDNGKLQDINTRIVLHPTIDIPISANEEGMPILDEQAFIKQLNEQVCNTEPAATISQKNKLYEQAKQKADQYDVLYHCTSARALISIIKSRRFYLSSLERVNDNEEARKINDEQIRDKAFVACFTYDPNVSKEHWQEYVREGEYSEQPKGLLFSIKPKWFLRKIASVYDNRMNRCDITVYPSNQEAPELEIGQSIKDSAYYISNYDFIQVDYGDLTYEVKEQNGTVSISHMGIVGIVKDEIGECTRRDGSSYTKNWADEKEVRLRSIIGGSDSDLKLPFCCIEVELDECSFDEFEVIFQPNTLQEDKIKLKEQLRRLLPMSNITYR